MFKRLQLFMNIWERIGQADKRELCASWLSLKCSDIAFV